MEKIQYLWFTLIFQYSDVTAYGGSQPRFGEFSDFLTLVKKNSGPDTVSGQFRHVERLGNIATAIVCKAAS